MSRGGHQVVLVDLHEVLLPVRPSRVLQIPRVRFIKLRLLKHREAIDQCAFSVAFYEDLEGLRSSFARSYVCCSKTIKLLSPTEWKVYIP